MKNDLKNHKGESIPIIDLSKNNIPDLEKGKTSILDYSSDYWTPDKVGEKVRAYYLGCSNKKVKDIFKDGPPITLECVNLLVKDLEHHKTIYNGSKRLVAAFLDNSLEIGTPVEITYLGKKKNKTNSYSSDNWSIRPLIIKI